MGSEAAEDHSSATIVDGSYDDGVAFTRVRSLHTFRWGYYRTYFIAECLEKWDEQHLEIAQR
jgi:hypothetical protein